MVQPRPQNPNTDIRTGDSRVNAHWVTALFTNVSLLSFFRFFPAFPAVADGDTDAEFSSGARGSVYQMFCPTRLFGD